MFKLRRGRDPSPGKALPQAGPGQFGRALHRRVHVAARTAAEPARSACHRHLRRRRKRRGGLQGVHPGSVAVQREGRQAVQAAVRVPHLRHGQRRLHIQRGAVPGVEDDGGQQPEGHAAAADRGQDHLVRGQGRGRQDLVRGVLQRGGQHRHPQENGGGRVGGVTSRVHPPTCPLPRSALARKLFKLRVGRSAPVRVASRLLQGHCAQRTYVRHTRPR